MLGNAGSPGAEVFHCRGRRGTRGTMTGTYADAEPERNSDTACLSRTHAGTSFSAPPTANCSSRIRRCCPNFFLNFLSRCPWWLQASTRAIRRASFGLCKSSTLDGRGRPNGCLPLGFPATLRMASSSRRIHASVVLTGMTETRTTSDAAPSDASAISSDRSRYPTASASRWIKSRSNSDSAESTTRTFLSNTDSPPSPGSRMLVSAIAVPTTSAAPQCDSNFWRCATSALSEVPSHRRRKRTNRSYTRVWSSSPHFSPRGLREAALCAINVV